jgi:FkbM family methyltransferase
VSGLSASVDLGLSLLGQWTYTALVRSRSRAATRRLSRFRQAIIRWGDPIITMKLGDSSLKLNLSHQLPLYYNSYPNYDRALPRICSFLEASEGHLTFIDVGANIGDSVALVARQTPGRFLCIEGDVNYFALLKTNTSSLGARAVCENVFLGEEERTTRVAFEKKEGSLKLSGTESEGVVVKLVPLDRVVEMHPEFTTTNIVKVDTDGHDFKVLRGGAKLIQGSRPLLFVEFVPDLLSRNGDNPSALFPFLASLGYEYCLSYDNFGHPLFRFNIRDDARVQSMISSVDEKTIYYYDIVFVHKTKRDLTRLFDLELARQEA